MSIKNHLYLVFSVLFLSSIISLQQPAHARESDNQELEPITMQVRWLHQFQFAGYYAAVHKGFYRERGLDVTIVAGSPTRTPVNEVLAGRAHYAEANSELLYHYLKGAPLVALAAIFQHSPSVLLTRKDSGITTPHQLIGKRVMMVGGTEDIDFLSMLANEGISKTDIDIIPSTYNIQDLIDGKTDAFNAYVTNEPYYLKEHGIESLAIKPVNYGVDFYSDILFTTRKEIEDHPERVKAFREATLLGWEYAMDNKQEIIDLVQNEYNSAKSRAHSEFEAETMQNLILPKLVPIGNINPGRFKRMADVMVQFDLIEPNYSLDEFIYDPNPSVNRDLYIKTAMLFFVILVVTSLLAFMFWRFNCRLSNEIKQRHEAENKLKHVAHHDHLTNLPNRRLLSERLVQDISRSKRHGTKLAVAYLDLDGFKEINDKYGHQLGDKFLLAIAKKLEQCMRNGDTFSRFGGDEFVAVLTDLNDMNEALTVIQRLQECASTKIAVDGFMIGASVSIGVTFYPQEKDVSIDILLHQADHAMYEAKSSGKNQFNLFESDKTSE